MRAPAALLAIAALSLPSLARADDADRAAAARRAWPIDVFATGFVGDGLRFNNPFRLATILGSQAQSLSRTAAYADLGAAAVLGDPGVLAHGLALRASVALEGIGQSVLTPSYLLFRRWGRWGVYGRVGLPIVLTPDLTWGLEAGAGGTWFLRAGIGLAAELVGDVFYGAGTRDVQTPAYPVLSAQGGLWLSWEAL
jgi:transposase InsO family protein